MISFKVVIIIEFIIAFVAIVALPLTTVGTQEELRVTLQIAN